MLTALEIKEQQAQLRSEETLSEQYLTRIQEEIENHIKHSSLNSLEYYKTINDLTVSKLKDFGFNIDICSYTGKSIYVTKGIKISW
jgi:hypothetical protein